MLEYRIFYTASDGGARMTQPQVTEDTSNILKNATEYVRRTWYRIEVYTPSKPTWYGIQGGYPVALFERDPSDPPKDSYAPTWRVTPNPTTSSETHHLFHPAYQRSLPLRRQPLH